MVQLISLLIRGYQKISRFFLPCHCRFYPSCSSYALEALQKYGVMKGSIKTCLRIIRCSPLSSGGYDPLK